MKLKKCTCCNIEYPETLDFFFKKGGKQGLKGNLRSTCKKCTLLKNKESLLKWKRRQTNKMFWAAYTRAKNKNIEFSIKETDIIIPEKCPLLEIPLIPGIINTSKNSPTIDRKNNEKGYTPENIWVISHLANRIKCNLTTDELKTLVKNLNIYINDIV